MPTLPDLQDAFRAAIQSTPPQPLLATIDDSALSPDVRLRIYRNNVYSSLTDAVRALYPACEQLVGDDFMKGAARHYIDAHPPTNGRLGEYGHLFPAFLKDFAPAAQLPYLPDVAAVELAWHRAYHAAEATPLNPNALARVAPEDMTRLHLGLHPSAQLLTSRFPAGRIWQACQQDSGENLDVGSGADHLLVIRPDADVEVRFLSPGSFAFLGALDGGHTLVAAFEIAIEAEPGFDLGRNLQDFITGATFTGFRLSNV